MASDHGIYGPTGDVSPWDVRFDPADRAHLEAVAPDRFRFRVTTETGLEDGALVERTGGGATVHPMTPWARTDRFAFWEVTISEMPPGAGYSFAWRTAHESPVYFAPSGITNAVERLDRWTFEPPQPLDIPRWALGAVIYQVFPDRFARGDGDEGDGGSADPDRLRRHGGDLAGVRRRLDHISRLGVDALYLNPIFTSPSNHRYDTIDYFSVDPALGGDRALADLVAAAHDRNIRVILDTSLNHVHPRFFAFADVVANGRRSPYRDWFKVREWPPTIKVRPRRGSRRTSREAIERWRRETGLAVEVISGPGPEVEPNYEAWYGVPTMPRVDLANPDARAYMLGVAAHWVAEFGIDGWRMDVARYVDQDVWQDLRTAVRSANPEAYLLAEIMGDARQWLQGDRFDATMNYTFRDLVVRFLGTAEIGAASMVDGLARLDAMYARQVTLANHNLIGSHDTPRFLTIAGGDVASLRLATVLQLTFPGAPGIYYGDEIGMTGGADPGSRGAFPWHTDHPDHPVLQTIGELTALRRRHRSLVEGDWRPREARGGLLVFDRVHGRERLTVAINRDRRAATLAVGSAARVIWGDAKVGGAGARVSGRGAAVLRV